MKKIITILLVSLMVLTLTGCNKKQEETVVEEPTVQEVVKQEEPKKEETVTPIPEVKEEVVEEVKEEEKVDVTTLSYWVNFVNPDGSLISRKAYKYGETPVYPTNPEYFDGIAYYAFREWDKKLSPVHMTQTYKALYDVTGYVKNEKPSTSTPANNKPSLSTTLSVDNVLTLICKNDDYSCDITYKVIAIDEEGFCYFELISASVKDTDGETVPNAVDDLDISIQAVNSNLYGNMAMLEFNHDGITIYFDSKKYSYSGTGHPELTDFMINDVSMFDELTSDETLG